MCKQQSVRHIEVQENEDTPEEFIGMIRKAKENKEDEDLVNVTVTASKHRARGNPSIKFLPDTGSTVDAIGETLFNTMFKGWSRQSVSQRSTVKAVNGEPLRCTGKIVCTLHHKGKCYDTEVKIFEGIDGAILSKKGCKALGLIGQSFPHETVAKLSVIDSDKIVHVSNNDDHDEKKCEKLKYKLMEKYSDVFEDTCLKPMQGPPVSIKLSEGAVPFKCTKPYNIAYHYREKVRAKLAEMEAQGLIERVPMDEPLTWLHPMVVVEKKNSTEPRITVDFKHLNKYIERPVHPHNAPREAVARVPKGMKFFTTLDAKSGYWQVALDEESRKYTAFITPFGCFRFCRVAMGLVSAGDSYNYRLSSAFEGINGMELVVEDFLVFDSSTIEDHFVHVEKVLQRCRERGITLNKKKFVFCKPVVEWCGYELSESGYSVSKNLIKALSNFPVPKSKTDVRSFMGLVNQFEPFAPELTDQMQPIRELLCKSAAFVWDKVRQDAFDEVRKTLSCPRILTHFDPGAKLRLETDAAQSRGMGFALWQSDPVNDNWRLLQCGSRSTTPAETRYSATEIEMQACVWAMRKTRLFTSGKCFELIVDHKPLLAILNYKTLNEIESPRQQRMAEKTRAYQFVTMWRPGSEHVVVDRLSRFPVDEPSEEDLLDCEENSDHVRYMVNQSNNEKTFGAVIVPDLLLENMRTEARVCGQYQKLMSLITRGFPEQKTDLDEDMREFWAERENFALDGDLVLMKSRIFVSKESRKKVLKDLHVSHQGQERTLKRARKAVYWPGMVNDIRNLIRNCEECILHLPSQAKEPMKPTISTYPFEVVHTDLFQHAGNEYLVLVDKLSGWPFLVKMGTSTSTEKVIRVLRKCFSLVGIPCMLVSDGGPQFKSMAFKEWCKSWGIKNEYSSPYNPRSNGLAEAAVKTLKKLVSKTTTNGNIETDAFYKAILELRNTPRVDGSSPAEVLFGRPVRGVIPMHKNIFRSPDDWIKNRLAVKQKQADHFNRDAKPLGELLPGQGVWVQDPVTKRWDKSGVIAEKLANRRSYSIQLSGGKTTWRNRIWLKPMANPEHEGDKESDVSKEEPSENVPRRSTRARTKPSRYEAGW